MKRILLFLLIFTLTLSACGPNAPQPATAKITVFAAASLTDAFSEIGAAFESAHPGVDVTFNFGGSNTLRAQIEQGAPADIFAPANTREMDTLVAAGLVVEPQTFATNQLVVVLPASNPGGIATLEDLATPGIKLVLAAEEVPAGRYALASLGYLNSLYGDDFSQRVLSNIVSREENVRVVLTKVLLGEADAGMVYRSDAAMADVLTLEIPESANVTAEYPIAVLEEADQNLLAADFVAFVLSSEAQAILAKYGFGSAADIPIQPATAPGRPTSCPVNHEQEG